MVNLLALTAKLVAAATLGATAGLLPTVRAYPSAITTDNAPGAIDQLLSSRSNALNNGTDFLSSLSPGQRHVFSTTLSMLDSNFQPPFIFGSSRYTAYYAISLLARNGPGDAALAKQLFHNAIAAQWKNASDIWYGAFLDPNQPAPGKLNKPKIYGSYDANSNLFVATAFMLAIEDFGHLMDHDTKNAVIESGYRAVGGDTYRVFGIDDDNLTPAYSNPWLMRCMAMSYYGHLKNDANMTMYAERYAGEFYSLFDMYDTLSEFNSATYTGVALWALSLGGYLPSNTTMAKRAGDTISKVWAKTAQLWQPQLNSLGGSWDRTYGFGLSDYVNLLGFYTAGLDDGSAKNWAEPWKLSGSPHVSDAAFAPLMAITSKFHDQYVSQKSREYLKPCSSVGKVGRLIKSNAWSPPFDADVKQYGPRNYTAWIGDNVSVGGTEIDEAVIGGPAKNPTAFTPAVMLWKTPDTHSLNYAQPKASWLSLYPTTQTISASASSSNLTIRFPPSRAFAANYTAPTQMTLMFGTSPLNNLPSDFLVSSNSTNGTLPGMELSFSGNVASGAVNRSLTYDSSKNINGFYYYNLTFALGGLPKDAVPELVVSYKVV
ncbi:hypothetical protein PHSY_001624 [Pseudozyma hubeiensis SY62]|uniref:Uncharacterized protein n=1 Tax=Pseudozyma hubeiensis (strain SY62) TaxID=1305764 RepID=R9P7H0_PSEHS|nr:hypothetical protein PHSY_001624 [Pseudozyma hubeiensis SY62]GAC94055.1 hypothetical protein PHSY_001624 [Pseudozyma hubeiensis SY62]